MKRLINFLVRALVLFTIMALALIWFIHTPYPPQPKSGFTGNWRTKSVFGSEERPLPPATNVWSDYTAWKKSATNQNTTRLYLARFGGVTNQSDFRSSHSSGDTPMGAQQHTEVEFTYTDPTNGIYLITWSLRGEHDTGFLRLDHTSRLYLLQPYGTPEDNPPRLHIWAIEGIRPEHYKGP